MASDISDGPAAPRAGRRIADGLHAAEAAVDAAMSEALTLKSLLPADPTAARTATSALTPVTALGRARVHLIRAHRVLADVARRIGLDEASVGPLDKPEDTPPIGGGPRRRRPAPDGAP